MKSIRNQYAWCARAQMTLTVLMVSLAVAFAALAWWPAQRRQAALRAEIAALTRKLQTDQARATNLPILAMEVDRLKLKLERFNKRLPKTAEIGEFIGDLTRASQQYQLRKLVHQPGQLRRLDLYNEIPITMNFEGEFTSVFAFLRQMEEMQRLTRVKTINVRLRDGKLGHVDCSMAMNIYYSEL